ncbi:MAG TPA: gliding motility-associated C-terminal domain-containing protein [Chitinophagales bacterium]|nr:gliding motility-associated C-terminal domain-containing protein [Chitinophagales bacterium]
MPGVSSLLAQAPGCPDVNAGIDQHLDCTTGCTTLSASIFQSGETSDYTVSSIPYAPPFPFTGGTQIFINIDDQWTNVINLPFNFCFYGNMYNQVIIGTNGVISFDLSYANNWCEWSFSAPIPTQGPPPAGIYNNSINGAYHDIDPNVSIFTPVFPFFTYPSNINYAVLGTAPCRTFVVNFSTVRHYQCNNLETTQQIVLYETTNAIEVYIKDKPTCTTWNAGNAVIGLQNIDGTKGITPPGRNTGPWSTTNEAWRFMPSGPPNWTFTWYDASGNVLGHNLSINVCPSGTSTYTAEGVYRACDGSTVVVRDDVTVNIAGGFTSSFTKTDESCAGCDGSVTVSVSGGTPPFSYDIGNGPQPSRNFTGLCAGAYSLTVMDAANCSGILNVTIAPTSAITVAESSTDETCFGFNDGTITLSASGGASPYLYDIGFGAPNNTGTFTALPPNTYNYSVTDATGCFATGTLIIDAAQVCCTMSNTVSSVNPSCNASCDGSITLTENQGMAPVQFSIDNGATFQSAGFFSGLCAGSYHILIEDALDCQFTAQITLTEPAPVSVSASVVNATCGCDGAITVTATGGGGAPYQYSIDNGNTFQSATLFSNVCPGSYSVVSADATGCRGTATAVVTSSSGLAITSVSTVNPSCPQSCDASLTITATGAQQYSIDNGATFQILNTFANLCSGSYPIVVTDGGNCRVIDNIILTAPPVITLSLTAADASCNAGCNGLLEGTAAGGTPPYYYSIDNGVNFQTGSQFNGLCAGSYDMLVADNNNCTAAASAIVNEPSSFNISLAVADVSCPQQCDGTVEITATGGTAPFTFSLPGKVPTTASPIRALCAGDFQLTVSDANNCSAIYPFTVAEPPLLTVNAGADMTVPLGESVTLHPVVSDTSLVATPRWTPPDGLNCTICLDNMATPLQTTLYTLMIEDVNGCLYSDDVKITVTSEPLVNIPNAFSPNGDRMNDVFLITGREISFIHFMVFNRWGEKLFETTDLSAGWDGTYRGKSLQPGVYAYLAEVTYLSGERDIFKGSITLVR